MTSKDVTRASIRGTCGTRPGDSGKEAESRGRESPGRERRRESVMALPEGGRVERTRERGRRPVLGWVSLYVETPARGGGRDSPYGTAPAQCLRATMATSGTLRATRRTAGSLAYATRCGGCWYLVRPVAGMLGGRRGRSA